ncbi:hypothetical protein ACFVZD_32150 [Streptomyces sp. NPDC058287]|uniref:hypothetical protein n=1 Tax=unclassified Streptomyces TaxID=2593676 RepID=UPI0036E1135A
MTTDDLLFQRVSLGHAVQLTDQWRPPTGRSRQRCRPLALRLPTLTLDEAQEQLPPLSSVLDDGKRMMGRSILGSYFRSCR